MAVRIKSILLLAGGAGAGQIILLLVLPLLTRLYSPESFASLAIFSSFLSVFIAISSLRFEVAIPIVEDKNEVYSIILLCVVVTSAISFFLLVTVFFLNDFLDSKYKYLNLLPAAVFFAGINNTFSYLYIKHKNFSILAASNILQAIAAIATQVLAAVIFKSDYGLIYGVIINWVVGACFLATYNKSEFSKVFRWCHFASLLKVSRNQVNFPIYWAPHAMLNSISSQLPIVIFSLYFKDLLIGYYSLAQRTAFAPLSLVGRSLSKVYLSEATENRRLDNLGSYTLGYSSFLMLLSIPSALVLTPFFPFFFSLVFGDAWVTAGEYLQIMTPWLVMQFIASPLSSTIAVTGLQKYGLISQLIFVAIRIPAAFLGYMFGDFKSAIALFSAASFLCYFFYFAWVLHSVSVKISLLISTFARALIIGLIALCFCLHIVNLAADIFPLSEAVIVIISLALCLSFSFYENKRILR